MEYFGLEHWTPNQKESRTHQWINLRNRLSCDGGSGSGIQLMLALRVKFWVPVHFILQESVRNLFYMQAKVDLLEGRLSARNWSSAAKLAALLCQADGLRFNEASLKSECPLKIKRDQERLRRLQQEQHQQQQQLLQQQHQQAASKERKEKDYVLSFKKRRLSKQKSVENIDNVQCQASTSFAAAAAVAALAVHSSTPTNNVDNNKPTSSTNETPAKVSNELNYACDIKQQEQEPDASIEKRISASPLRIYQDYIVRPVNEQTSELPEDFLKQIAVEHGKLSMLKMSPKSAKYWLLQEIPDLPGYGEEVFSGVTTSEISQRCDIAVGAHGIKILTGDNERKYVYCKHLKKLPFLISIFLYTFF